MRIEGMGLMQLKPFNRTLVAKQFWRVISNSNQLLRQVIIHKYGRGNREDIDHSHSNGS